MAAFFKIAPLDSDPPPPQFFPIQSGLFRREEIDQIDVKGSQPAEPPVDKHRRSVKTAYMVAGNILQFSVGKSNAGSILIQSGHIGCKPFRQLLQFPQCTGIFRGKSAVQCTRFLKMVNRDFCCNLFPVICVRAGAGTAAAPQVPDCRHGYPQALPPPVFSMRICCTESVPPTGCPA